MKFLLKAEEGEQLKYSTSWDLTFYDDETGKIDKITEFAHHENHEVTNGK